MCSQKCPMQLAGHNNSMTLIMGATQSRKSVCLQHKTLKVKSYEALKHHDVEKSCVRFIMVPKRKATSVVTCGSVRSYVGTPGPPAHLSTRWLCWTRPGRPSCAHLVRWYVWSHPALSLANKHRTGLRAWSKANSEALLGFSVYSLVTDGKVYMMKHASFLVFGDEKSLHTQPKPALNKDFLIKTHSS